MRLEDATDSIELGRWPMKPVHFPAVASLPSLMERGQLCPRVDV